jgi:hypothetical protein
MFVVWKSRPVTGSKKVPFLQDDALVRERPECETAWKPLTCGHRRAGLAWTPLVVRAERRDGKPRQKLVYRLPSIRACCVADEFCRAAWWYDIDRTIKFWKEVNGFAYIARDEEAILAKLRAVVPPPTRAGRRDFATYRRWREREQQARWGETDPVLWLAAEEAARRPDEAPDQARRQADDEWRRYEQARHAAETSARRCADGWGRRPAVGLAEQQERTRRAETGWVRFEQAEHEQQARYRRWSEGQERRRQEEERRRQEDEERQRLEEELRRLEEALRRLAEELRRQEEQRRRQADARSGRGQHDGRSSGDARSVPPSAAAALAVLGLTFPCTMEQIKVAYRKAMLKWHPDVGGTNAQARAVNAAYELVKTHFEGH